MAEPKKKEEEQAQTTQTPGTETPKTEIPDFQADREELMEASQQFFRSLFRAGVHLAFAPVNILPEEPREHFKAAGREFSQGLATLAQELANDFEKIVHEVNEANEAEVNE